MPFEAPVTRERLLRRIRAHPLGETPEEMRRAFHDLVVGPATGRMRRQVSVAEDPGGLTVRSVDASGFTAMPRIVWFHGGGYVFGSPETHIRPAIRLADHHRFTVRLPRYRLAPEHPWPAQRDDAVAEAEAAPAPVILAGDSAGGHLALVTALRMVRAGNAPLALLLFSPNTDRSGLNTGRARMDALDPMVDDAGDRRLARMCFGDMADDHPEVSPVLDDLSLLPPTWIEVGTPEVLHGDAVALHRRATEQGAEVHLHETPGLLHMGQLWQPWWGEATASIDRAAAFALSKAAERRNEAAA